MEKGVLDILVEHFLDKKLESAMKQDDKNGVFNHTLTFSPVKARYVKVTALTEHSIPAWHGGKGNPAFLFVDEISLN